MLHVPLIIKYPKRWAQTGRRADPIQLTDIMPIILDRLGIPVPDHVQGTPTLAGRPNPLAEVFTLPVISKLGHFRAYYQGDLKYIWNSRGRHGLYDLKADPGEAHDLYRTELEKASSMRSAMNALVDSLPRPAESTIVKKIDKKTMETLRSLNYIPGPSKKKATTSAASTSPATK